MTPVGFVLLLLWLSYWPFGFWLLINYAVHSGRIESKGTRHPDPSITLLISITTKGDYPALVDSVVRRVRSVCQGANFTSYDLEVVTDNPDERHPCRMFVVPAGFTTPNGSRRKCRALQYALERRRKEYGELSTVWTWHFDEETLLTRQALDAVLQYIADGGPPVAEGMIVYSEGYMQGWNLLPSTMESVRAFGCYTCRTEMESKGCPSHMHGSNLLVRADIEDKVGWDFGDSVAEDQRFGFEAYRQFGDVFGWHGGTLIESPPRDVASAFRQRRRWSMAIKQNLPNLERRADRAYHVARLTSWSAGFFSAIGLWMNFLLLHAELPRWLGPILLVGMFLWLAPYALGARDNLRYSAGGWWHRAKAYAASLALAPVVAFVDCFGAFAGLLTRGPYWVVTKKLGAETPPRLGGARPSVP